MNKILDKVNEPKDLKTLTRSELIKLCDEIREQMIVRLSATGGHIGSNLGIIEVTVALHYIFHSAFDKIIFDVSHQCYTHKLLTGRKNAYIDPEEYSSVSGFTNPDESVHDVFSIGHTSTSISLACGLAKSRDLKGETNNVVVVIGDGALSGGEAFEGLNNAASLDTNIIIIVNDNNMSIAENYGGLYQNLKLLRETEGKADCNFFKSLNLDYYFIRNGNNLNELIDGISKLKDVDHPVVIHICTTKGKGYYFSEKNKEIWHYSNPFDIATGKPYQDTTTIETYENLTRDYLINKMKQDSNIIAVTAGTPKILGFDKPLRKQYQKQFIDVGIAEEHAIAMVSGIAKNGSKPIFGVSSTFLQRTYDQLSHDLALNHSSAVILVFFAGISQSSQTHMGVFDIPLVMNIPNIIYLAPTCKEEYLSMLNWGLKQSENPVIIRVPGIKTLSRKTELLYEYNYPAKYEIVDYGANIAILALGNFFELGYKVKKILFNEYGINATLINPRYITGFDIDILEKLKHNHRIVVTLEDGVIDGGFGEKISRFYGNSKMQVLNFGAKKEFVNHLTVKEQYNKYHLNEKQIVSDILHLLL